MALTGDLVGVEAVVEAQLIATWDEIERNIEARHCPRAAAYSDAGLVAEITCLQRDMDDRRTRYHAAVAAGDRYTAGAQFVAFRSARCAFNSHLDELTRRHPEPPSPAGPA